MPWIEPHEVAAALRVAEAGPTHADLDWAPQLRAWSVVTYPGEANIRLMGRVRGHPIVEGTVTTSPLVAMGLSGGRAPGDSDGDCDGDGTDAAAWGWARTLGRWYNVETTSFRPADPATREEELAAVLDGLRGYRRAMAKAFGGAVH